MRLKPSSTVLEVDIESKNPDNNASTKCMALGYLHFC